MSKLLSGRHGAVFPRGRRLGLRAVAILLAASLPLQVGWAPAEQQISAEQQTPVERQTSTERQTSAQQPVFEASVEQVRVDVIVTDDAGQFVDDLGFEDFLVYEDGALQQVLSVQLVDLGVGTVADIQPLPAEQAPGRVSTDPTAEVPVARPAGNDYGAMIFLIDGSSLDPRARIRFARQWGEVLEETQILNVPRAAYLLDQAGTLRELAPLTHNADALRAVAESVQSDSALGTSMERELVRLLNERQDPATSDDAIRQARAFENQERYRSFATLELLTQFCDALAARSGRTALVWVSSGIKLTVGGPHWAAAGDDPGQNLTRDPSILARQAALHEAANSANVSIYSVDPTTPGDLQSVGFDVASQRSGSGFANEEFDPSTELDRVNEIDAAVDGLRDSLRHAAGATGGEAFIQWGDTARALKTIEEDGRRYYLITYAVPAPQGDNEYHEIRVEVQSRDVEVRARGGYVDLPPVERRTRAVAAALKLPGAVAAVPIAAKAFHAWSPEGQPVVELAVTLESEAAAWAAVAAAAESSVPWIELHALALDDGMEIVDEFHFEVQPPGWSPPEEGHTEEAAPRPYVYLHTWALPPGEHDVRIVVNDEARGQFGAAQMNIDVPAADLDWATSDLMLAVTEGRRPSQPLIDNEVFSQERLEISLEVFGGQKPVLSGKLLSPEPNQPPLELQELPMTQDGAGIHHGLLLLEEVPPGEFTLEVRIFDPPANEERVFQVPLSSSRAGDPRAPRQLTSQRQPTAPQVSAAQADPRNTPRAPARTLDRPPKAEPAPGKTPAAQPRSRPPVGLEQKRAMFGAEVEMVTIPVSVVDSADSPVGDLTPEDFTITDDGVEHEVAVLLRPGDTPLEVALLLDLSFSMDAKADEAKRAALSFLEQLSDDDCVLYLPFGNSFGMGAWSHPKDPDLESRVMGSRMVGETRLYDALVGSFYQVELGQGRCGTLPGFPPASPTDRIPRRALVVVTDGFDVGSILSFEHALSAASQAQIPVFPVAIGEITRDAEYSGSRRFNRYEWTNPAFGGSNPRRARAELQGFARATGGQYIDGGRSVETLEDAYAQILRWLRSYYIVGYYVETPEPGYLDPELPVWHEVQVRLRPRGYELHTRPGYYRSPTDRERARYHIDEGTELARKELPTEALLEFDLAVHADPYYWEAHYRRGGALAMAGDLQAAQWAFLRAVALKPGTAEVHKMVSLVSQRVGDYEAAWNHAIRAYQAGASMTAEMQALSRETEPPADLDVQLGAPRIYVQTAFAADPVSNVALGRMLRTLRVALSEAPGIGLIDLRERAKYELVIEPRDLSDQKPRKLEADLLLMNTDGEQVFERRLTLADIDDQDKVAAGLRPYIADLQELLRGQDRSAASLKQSMREW